MKKGEFFICLADAGKELRESTRGGVPDIRGIARKHNLPITTSRTLESDIGEAIGLASLSDAHPADIVAYFEKAWEEYESLPAEKKVA